MGHKRSVYGGYGCRRENLGLLLQLPLGLPLLSALGCPPLRRPAHLHPLRHQLRHGLPPRCTPWAPPQLGLRPLPCGRGLSRGGRGLTSRGSLGGGLPTQNAGRTLQGVDVRLERLDLGVPGRDGCGDLFHGGDCTGGVGGCQTHWSVRSVAPLPQWCEGRQRPATTSEAGRTPRLLPNRSSLTSRTAQVVGFLRESTDAMMCSCMTLQRRGLVGGAAV